MFWSLSFPTWTLGVRILSGAWSRRFGARSIAETEGSGRDKLAREPLTFFLLRAVLLLDTESDAHVPPCVLQIPRPPTSDSWSPR